MSNYTLKQVEKDVEERIAQLEYEYNDLLMHYKKLQYKAARYDTSNDLSSMIRRMCGWVVLFLIGVYVGVNYL